MSLIQKTFPGSVISRAGEINWLPKSCDLTPLDFFVGYAKDGVYTDKRSILDYLKTNIRQVMVEISPNMCQKVVANYLKRNHEMDNPIFFVCLYSLHIK